MIEQKIQNSESANLLDQFNLLQSTGALDDLSYLRKENRELDKLINDASSLMSLTSVSEMLDFVISRLLDNFIPTFLAFLIQPPRGEHIRQYCYRNLKQVNEKVPANYYQVLKQRFMDFPGVLDKEELNSCEDTWELGEDFWKYQPELIYPMRSIGGLYGIVILGAKVLGEEYSELEQLYVDRMTRFLAVGIQNGLHHESSITDPKTGVYNHDYFMSRLESEVSRIKRHGGRAGVIMLDVDHFKSFNDVHGHLAGDEALVTLADVLRSVLREEDTVSRFGGEEFVVLTIAQNDDSLFDVAERIRKAVENTKIIWEGEELSITISLGVREFNQACIMDSRTLVKDADKAMYQSKENGRNRVTLFKNGLLRKASILRAKLLE